MSEWTGTYALSPETLAGALDLPTPTTDQQAVIAAAPAPALVVAGAGSGKTETMAARVVWLVANGHVRREEVLGLTFTRKAAGELSERIMRRLQRIDEFERRGLFPHLEAIVATGVLRGVDGIELTRLLDRLALRYQTGYDPHTATAATELLRPRVATYNAFADGIVREHAARIGRDSEATLLSQAGSWLLARSVVLRSRDDRLIDTERPLSTVVEAVQVLAADGLDNRADLDAVAEFGRNQAALLEPHVDPNTVDETAKVWAAMSALPVLCDLAKEYALAKHAQGVLDFADQVSGALQVVEATPAVAEALRAEFRVVLLDEYQDTSVLQTRLLAAIFADHAVMAVGDPFQSIYGWRGASADNLDAFEHAFARESDCQHYSLMTSWRNDADVLKAANALLVEFRQRPGHRAVGELAPRGGAPRGVVEHIWAASLEEEADAVAAWFVEVRAEHAAAAQRRIAEAAAAGNEITVPEHAGALLFRAKKHMQTFAEALARHGVPHRILGLGGLLSTPEVTDVVAALRVVHDPTAGSSLLRILSGPRFAIGVADLAALHALARTLSQRDANLTKLPEELIARLRGSAGADEAVSIIDALEFVRVVASNHTMLGEFTEAGRERLREAGAMFDRLRRAGGRAIPELIRLIETELRLDIELAANETRGPARIAATQLRAFIDEVRSFLDADSRGTVGSLLAWLAHAEETDELMPRPEQPQPGVVQLLTVHAAKGLEWDATAVVRLVEMELPKSAKSTFGWLGFGQLPYAFRGDKAALPHWELPADDERTRSSITKSIVAFKGLEKAHQEDEERRLAYVAVTRAKSHLLLSGATWGGQIKPRKPSKYLNEMLVALGRDPVEVEADEADRVAKSGRPVSWPADPLGERRDVVQLAAEAVRTAPVGEPTAEIAALLLERTRRATRTAATAPARIPASMFKDFVHDYTGTVRQLERPMPERPYPQTRIGTDFHAWIEHRFETVGAGASLDDALWEADVEEAPIAVAEHDAELRRLQENFLQSEWAGLRPLEVECEVNYVLHPADGGQAHVMICKLDAVFVRADGRVEIVDWKTGAAPKTPAQRAERLLQLAHYRVAYHHARNVPLENIDVALFYVGENIVLRPDTVLSEAELAARLATARATNDA